METANSASQSTSAGGPSGVIDQYMLRYRAALDSVPVKIANEFSREARQHLDSLAAAEVLAGKPVDEAERSAVGQFGNAGEMGGKMVEEYRRKRAFYLSKDESLSIIVCVLVVLGPAIISLFRVPFQVSWGRGNALPPYYLPFLFSLNLFAPLSIALGLLFPRTAVKIVTLLSALQGLFSLAERFIINGMVHHSTANSIINRTALWQSLVLVAVAVVPSIACAWITSALRLRYLEKKASVPFARAVGA
jgi:hypothetical protein